MGILEQSKNAVFMGFQEMLVLKNVNGGYAKVKKSYIIILIPYPSTVSKRI
jgi:hypothetical protein